MAIEIDKELIDPDVEPTSEKAHRIVRALASVIPTGTELLNTLITPPLEKRKNEWMIQVTDALNFLLENGLSIDELQNNEHFISVLIESSNIAVRTHNERRREALKNVILNVGTNQRHDEALDEMILSLLDQCTQYHIQDLDDIKNKRNHSYKHQGLLEEGERTDGYDEIELHKAVEADLIRMGLLDLKAYSETEKGDGNNIVKYVSPKSISVTYLGNQLLEYISHPTTE